MGRGLTARPTSRRSTRPGAWTPFEATTGTTTTTTDDVNVVDDGDDEDASVVVVKSDSNVPKIIWPKTDESCCKKLPTRSF